MALLSTILAALTRKAILVGLVALALFLLVEVALWLFAPVPPHLTYRFELKNHMEPFGLGNESVFEVDSREIRHRAPAESRPEEARILIVGGEGTYQPLQNVEDTWWGRLASSMEGALPHVGIRMAVKARPPAQAGDETSMRHGLRWAKTYGPEVKPDILVISYGLSEVLDIPQEYAYDPALMATLPALPRPSALKDRALAVSQLARRLRHWRASRSPAVIERQAALQEDNFLLKTMGRQRALYESLTFDGQPPRREGEGDPLREYLDGLRGFKTLADQLGAKLIVLAEPSMHDNILGLSESSRLKRPRWLAKPSAEEPAGSGLRPDPAWVEAELNRYYAAAQQWAEKEGIPFLDLNRDERLPKTTTYFVDDCTLTQTGSAKVAHEVAPLLLGAVKDAVGNEG